MLRIVLTNDDGIAAPGLAALFRVCRELGECTVVAPATPQSGVGHATTTSDAIEIALHVEGWYAVGGTPVDCARLAVSELCPDADWVISGINAGGNLGADVYVSGTVAAAREAALLGRPAVAISQFLARTFPVDWSASERHAATALRELLSRDHEDGHFWNVNLPHLAAPNDSPSLRDCRLDFNPLEIAYETVWEGDRATARYSGSYHERKRTPERDVDVCFGGDIAVTRVPLELHRDE